MSDSREKEGYTFAISKTAYGIEHKFFGPGMSQYIGVHFLQPLNDWALKYLAVEELDQRPSGDKDAERICRMLAAAFEAGRQDAKRELRIWLGVPPA